MITITITAAAISPAFCAILSYLLFFYSGFRFSFLSFKFLENLKTCYEKKSKIHPKANLVVHQIIVGVKNVVGGKDNKNR
jgi:hypothetical protein